MSAGLRRVFLLALAVLLLQPVPTSAEAGGGPLALLDRLEGAWKARDGEAYLSLWEFASDEARAEERTFVNGHLDSEETQIQLHRPEATSAGAPLRAGLQVFSLTEPRARLEQWVLALERRPAGWAIVGREPAGQVDGLVHLSLDPAGYRADGLTLRLPDFELAMTRGTLFTSPGSVGPTVLVFVGEGTVRVTPGPDTEREQLRQFCGRPEMVERVRTAFIRIHPADLHKVLSPARFDPDPHAASRLRDAQRTYRANIERSFILDASLPRSPWWLFPGLGDAAVTFDAGRKGPLTLTVSSSEAEDLSLFDRTRRLQICLYGSKGGTPRYSEDAGRAADVLHHDLSARFEPSRYVVAAEDTLRLRLLTASSTLRLRLDEALRVESITSREGGRHLFFRVRGQDSLVVSLGALSGTLGEVSLTVRYAGTLRPSPVEQEVTQVSTPPPVAGVAVPEEILIEQVLVYTNRLFWYPTAGTDDQATATLRFDVPVGFTAVTGGTRSLARVEGGRTLVEYRQDRPGKYISVAVGRLNDVGARQAGDVALQGFALARTRMEATETLAQAGEILRFFSEQFGPCPYTNLNVVVVEGLAPGGHSPPGMVILSQRPYLLRRALRDDPANFTDVPGFFLAHELAHQWWGHGVAGQNYHERWLSEGAAQYAAALWARHSRGEETFRGVLGRMARWAIKESKAGPISLGHRLGHIQGDRQVYRAVVYDKGAYVFHMLRRIAGEEAFRRALAAFQERHRFGKAGTDDLREAFEAATGRALAGYFDQWVYGTAIPRLRFSSRVEPNAEGYRTVVEVAVDELGSPVLLEVAVSQTSGREARRVTLEPGGGRFTIDTATRPGRVEINGDRGVLARVKK